MKFLCRHWQHLAAIMFVGLAFYMGFFGGHQLSTLQVFMIMSLMALLAHQSEEYILPGGAALVINLGVYHEPQNYRNFPGNTLSSMLVNVISWLFYLLGIIFPHWIWLGLGIMFFNLIQLPGHALMMNKALKTWYNPGMATAICLLTPVSVGYFIYIVENNLEVPLDWLLGVVVLIVAMIAIIILPVQLLKNPNSPYKVSDWQVQQYRKVKAFASWQK